MFFQEIRKQINQQHTTMHAVIKKITSLLHGTVSLLSTFGKQKKNLIIK